MRPACDSLCLPEPARVVMYTQDSFGLGHLRRATNLANGLIARRPDASVLLVVDSPVAPFFELGEHIDFVKLPTVVKVDAGVFRPGRLAGGYEPLRLMRADVIRDVLALFRPHLLLVDHMPGGANQELLPALSMIRRENLPTTVVLGLRDIIDGSEATCALWQRESVYETIQEFYDGVLIYGAAEVFATAQAYRLSDATRALVRYCGYVCSMDPAKHRRRIRARLGVGDGPLVAVMAGGGWDGFQLLRTCLDAARSLRERRCRFDMVTVTGPFMPEPQRRELRELAHRCGSRIHTSIGDPVSHINAADVVVSMAGYNTLCEILRFRKRAIVVPRPGPSAEQRMRAEIFAKRGLVRVVDTTELTSDRMSQELAGALAGPELPEAMPPGNLAGVAGAVDFMCTRLPAAPPETAVAMAAAAGARA